jgi:NitT/TauT family transport system substrate-binding protein
MRPHQKLDARPMRAHALIPSLLLLIASTAPAADGIRVCLNWAPGADHAPLYAARQEGTYAAADLAVELVPGGGSGDAISKLAGGECEVAVADLGAVIAARAKSTDVVAVMALMAASPLAFYSIDGQPLASVRHLTGRRIAADPKELARRLWPRLAALHGLDAAAVTWVDMPNNAKVDALAKGDADVAANTFYHHHTEFEAAFGDRLRALRWRDLGIDPYGNVLVARAGAETSGLARFVPIVQRATAACAVDPAPCLEALLLANPFLDTGREAAKWRAVRPLLAPPSLAGTPLGAFDPARLAAGLPERGPRQPGLEPEDAVTARFLDPSVLRP